jgi:NitT/TauT family transport system substrate-binding protein
MAVRVLPLTATGYDIYHAVICRRELLRKDPEIVRAFVAASIRGWNDYITNDPAPAHELILARNRDMTAGQLAFSRQALIDHALVAGYADRGEATGQLRLERIQREIDRLLEFRVLEKSLRADEVATTAYLP